jgi:predicted ester cyclase
MIMKKLLIGLAVGAGFLAACNSKTTVTASAGVDSTLIKNKATALASEWAMIKKDVDGAYKDCTPDFVDYGNGEGKPMKNLDSLKASFKDFIAAFPDLKAEDVKAYADSNTVVVTGIWSGTFTKEFMKIAPTHKMYKAPDADIFTFNKDGKITSHKSIQSEATYFAQLGITPPKK